MNKTTEALELAEKTLRDIIRVYKFETGTPVTALAAVREVLAEQDKQEPVAIVDEIGKRLDGTYIFNAVGKVDVGQPLYAATVSAEPCKECGAKQAQIDRLMLEYCPDEMTHEQMQEWEKNIKPFVEPENQESVAVISESAIGLVKLHSNGACLPFGTQLYAAPIEHQWVDLTDDEIDESYEQAGKALRRWQSSVHGQTVSPADLLNTHFAWAVIAAFKEKNK